MRNMTTDTKIHKVIGHTAAGTTDIQGTPVDAAGFRNATILASLGTVAGGATIRLIPQTAISTSSTDLVDLTAATIGSTNASTAYAETMIAVDLMGPTRRYVSAKIGRSTNGNVEIDAVHIVLHGARELPVTNSSLSFSTVAVGVST